MLELHADTGAAFGAGREGDLDAAQLPVVLGEFALALQIADEHGCFWLATALVNISPALHGSGRCCAG